MWKLWHYGHKKKQEKRSAMCVFEHGSQAGRWLVATGRTCVDVGRDLVDTWQRVEHAHLILGVLGQQCLRHHV